MPEADFRVSHSSAELRSGLSDYLGQLAELRKSPLNSDPAIRTGISRLVLQAHVMVVSLEDGVTSGVRLAEVYRTAVEISNDSYKQQIPKRI